jgi:hypothetical protein
MQCPPLLGPNILLLVSHSHEPRANCADLHISILAFFGPQTRRHGVLYSSVADLSCLISQILIGYCRSQTFELCRHYAMMRRQLHLVAFSADQSSSSIVNNVDKRFYDFGLFFVFWKNKTRLMRSPCSLYVRRLFGRIDDEWVFSIRSVYYQVKKRFAFLRTFSNLWYLCYLPIDLHNQQIPAADV